MTSDEQDGGSSVGERRCLDAGFADGFATGLAALTLDEVRALGAVLQDRITDGNATLDDYGAFVRARQELARRGEDAPALIIAPHP